MMLLGSQRNLDDSTNKIVPDHSHQSLVLTHTGHGKQVVANLGFQTDSIVVGSDHLNVL